MTAPFVCLGIGRRSAAVRICFKDTLNSSGPLEVARARALGAPLDRAGRILFGSDAAGPQHPEVFALGDLAAPIDSAGKPIPGRPPHASLR